MMAKGGMGNLMKQAQKMQQKMMQMQEELANREVSAQAGGGMVEATVNGRGELLGLRLEPEVIDPDDAEMLVRPGRGRRGRGPAPGPADDAGRNGQSHRRDEYPRFDVAPDGELCTPAQCKS